MWKVTVITSTLHAGGQLSSLQTFSEPDRRMVIGYGVDIVHHSLQKGDKLTTVNLPKMDSTWAQVCGASLEQTTKCP